MFCFTDRQADFDQAILSLRHAAFAHLDFFSDEEIAQLRRATERLPFRKASSVAGNNVVQDFDICFPAPLCGAFKKTATGLESLVEKLSKKLPHLIDGPFQINDFAVQKYAAMSKGIGIHKDSATYRHFVFIITLSGSSDLFICTDRQGNKRQVIDDRPGRLVILPAPGFFYLTEPDKRPLHGVDNITQGRLSLGFRSKR